MTEFAWIFNEHSIITSLVLAATVNYLIVTVAGMFE